jgi:hypothetical protein
MVNYASNMYSELGLNKGKQISSFYIHVYQGEAVNPAFAAAYSVAKAIPFKPGYKRGLSTGLGSFLLPYTLR